MSRKRTHRRQASTISWAAAILDSRPFSEADATAIVNKVRAALLLLLEGKADPVHFITLGCAINVATIRAEEISVELIDILSAAGEAMNHAQRIRDTHGRYGLTGPGRHHVSSGIDAYEAVLRASSPKQMQLAEQEVRRRLNVIERRAA